MILVTDIVFPSKYAKWRIEESKAFIDRYQADFLVFKVDSYANITYDIDYEEMEEYYKLKDYNIIIFDKKYNHLNKYNTRIDGTKFNRVNGFSYLFTRSETFDVTQYKNIYHIFLSMYERFNSSFKVEHNKQFIHLYPGGGLSNKSAINKIHKDTNLISTNHITTQWLKEYKYTNYIDVFGGTFLPKDNIVIPKTKNEGTLRICFSSMGAAAQKGATIYKLLAENYKCTFPKHNVEFISIGNGLPSKAITAHKPMSIRELDKFYREHVDIIVNLENGTAYNGWPLGCEAMLQGSVLITTDVYSSIKHTSYTNDMMFIVGKQDIKNMTKIITKLYNDRDLLLSMSNNVQNHTNKIFSYENQQEKIFDFIDNRFKTLATLMYHSFSPRSFVDNTIYKVKEKVFPMVSKQNVVIENNDIKKLIFDNISNGKAMSLSRYNDGEWVCMLRIPDHNLYNIHKVKWDKNTEDFVDKNITPIVKTISYYVGISNEVMKKDFITKHIYDYIKDMKLFDGGLFARWQIDGTNFEFLDLLNGKNVIIVGPDYLEKLRKYIDFKHIVTDNDLVMTRTSLITKNNGFKDRCAVVYQYDSLAKQLNDAIQDKCIVLYACAFVSKKFIHDHHTKDIIQIDVGASFDNVCGLQTRPWHYQ